MENVVDFINFQMLFNVKLKPVYLSQNFNSVYEKKEP